jgi:hypothetical protein
VLVGCSLLISTALAIAPERAHAQLPEEAPNISNELLDPDGRTRGHFVARASFADGQKTFSSSSLWSFEARFHVRIIEGLAATVVLPFGYLNLPAPGPQQFFFGNFSLGVAGGGRIHLASDSTPESPGPLLRWGGGLEAYAPSAPRPNMGLTPNTQMATDSRFLAEQAVARMRSYEPELYVGDVMSFRARLHADVSFNIVTAELELGLAPAFTLTSESSFLMWFSGAGRVSVRPINEVEPYLEMGAAVQVVGKNPLSPPFLITPGVRFHFWNLDPALFASFNFIDGKNIIFGVDLAGALRKTRADIGEDVGMDRFHL